MEAKKQIFRGILVFLWGVWASQPLFAQSTANSNHSQKLRGSPSWQKSDLIADRLLVSLNQYQITQRHLEIQTIIKNIVFGKSYPNFSADWSKILDETIEDTILGLELDVRGQSDLEKRDLNKIIEHPWLLRYQLTKDELIVIVRLISAVLNAQSLRSDQKDASYGKYEIRFYKNAKIYTPIQI